jgi:hypothetical protein
MPHKSPCYAKIELRTAPCALQNHFALGGNQWPFTLPQMP